MAAIVCQGGASLGYPGVAPAGCQKSPSRMGLGRRPVSLEISGRG